MRQFTARDLQRNIGQVQDAALKAPVAVTHHGRDRLVILSAEEYRRLKRYDRQALFVGELSDEDLSAIAAAEVPRRRPTRRPRHAARSR